VVDKESGEVMKDKLFILSEEEVRAIVEEFSHSWISHENPLCLEAFKKMMAFVQEIDNARQSQNN